jgi:hypothetical protein
MDPSKSVCRVFHHIVTTMTFHIIVVFDIIVASVIPLVALLILSFVLWREEHLWNFSVLQRVHLIHLVLLGVLHALA